MATFNQRTSNLELSSVQSSNRRWWTENTMSYDWKESITHDRYSAAWFEEIDKRFIHGARLFAHNRRPFDRIIPFDNIKGQRVLEIGCGMGLHTELLAAAGATVTSIDLSEISTQATKMRLQLKGLIADVRQMDAENLDFPDQSFDLVWTWGVIHHSSRTGKIIHHIHRVLRLCGEARIMVYNLEGMAAYISIVRKYLFGFWRGRGLDECLWSDTDGFCARFYTKDILADTLRMLFDDVTVQTFGQDADAFPVPRQLRRILMRTKSPAKIAEVGNRRGAFLFAIAKKSVPSGDGAGDRQPLSGAL